jgi:LacI family transcriptional regulator
VSGGSDGRITVAAIAREAGVSVPTVSRVLNGRADVAPRTRRRVEELLDRHGYRRASFWKHDPLLDLVFDDLDSPWAVEIIRGVEEVARELELGMVLAAMHGDAGKARNWLRNVRARGTNGVIMVTSFLEPGQQDELLRRDIPTVIVDPAGRPADDVTTIGATNWAGGLTATRHLLELGHRRIGFVAGPERLLCSRARLDGYRAALESAGLGLDPALVIEGDFHHESGFLAAQALLTTPHPPTAVFAASDQMAFGVYEAVRRSGLRVPDDISVVGFDDLPQARWACPPLTTIRQPLTEMGRMAVRTIAQLIRGEPINTPRVELATTLTVRSSTIAPV